MCRKSIPIEVPTRRVPRRECSKRMYPKVRDDNDRSLTIKTETLTKNLHFTLPCHLVYDSRLSVTSVHRDEGTLHESRIRGKDRWTRDGSEVEGWRCGTDDGKS